MFKKKGIQPLIEETTPAKSGWGGAVDHIAAGTGMMLTALGAAQLFVPLIASPFTGIEGSLAGQIIGLQWAVFGGLLVLGGLLRARVLTIFAGEFVALSALAAMAVFLINQRAIESALIYLLTAGLGFASSGFARLTDKAELKREIRLLREQAKAPPPPSDQEMKEASNG